MPVCFLKIERKGKGRDKNVGKFWEKLEKRKPIQTHFQKNYFSIKKTLASENGIQKGIKNLVNNCIWIIC